MDTLTILHLHQDFRGVSPAAPLKRVGVYIGAGVKVKQFPRSLKLRGPIANPVLGQANVSERVTQRRVILMVANCDIKFTRQWLAKLEARGCGRLSPFHSRSLLLGGGRRNVRRGGDPLEVAMCDLKGEGDVDARKEKRPMKIF